MAVLLQATVTGGRAARTLENERDPSTAEKGITVPDSPPVAMHRGCPTETGRSSASPKTVRTLLFHSSDLVVSVWFSVLSPTPGAPASPQLKQDTSADHMPPVSSGGVHSVLP